jgi:hypothetical protein
MLRRTPVVLTIASMLMLAAAFAPQLAPLILQAAVPGALLSLVAAGLRAFVERPAQPIQARPAPYPSAGSSTRFVPLPSIVIASSAMRPQDSATTPGRSAS